MKALLETTAACSSAGVATAPAVVTLLVDAAAADVDGRLVAGRYRLQTLLGRGGMSQVWLAQDEVLCRSVAIKQVMRGGPVLGDDPGALRAGALREARAAARIHHVGAVTVYDLVEDDGIVWVVMELLWGRTLEQALHAGGSLSVCEVTRLGLRLLDILQATHQAGVVHRDVKPGNIYLCDDGRVVLTDFGIACFTDDETTVDGAEFLGSATYVAPERVRGDQHGPASDLFSLGATMFAAVEGHPPFCRDAILPTLLATLEDEPGPFRCAGPLRPVIEGLLVKNPQRRMTADAARAALQGVQLRADASSVPATTNVRILV